jgi:HK97 family phage prohead protease
VSALLERTAAFELRADDEAGDGLTLDGIAATFGQPTEIDSWEGTFTEQIRRGAFRKTLRERSPVMQFDHGHHPLIGSIPIGSITDLRETDEGLAVQARLSDNWLMQPVRDAIAEGSISGMSFRFSVVREEWHDAAGKRVRPEELDQLLWNPGERGPLMRTLVEVRLHELGPVVFPAYASTSVGVRAASLAAEIHSDGDLRREVRAALAREAPRPPADDLDDPATRREVARALLFGSTPETMDAPPDGHPSAPERSEDAPADGHPSESDAPLPDEHPSTEPTERTRRIRGYIRDITARMDDVLDAIKE